MAGKLRIGALISGGGTNLQAVLDACDQTKIDGQVVFVGTDNPEARGLARAEKFNVPTFVVDYGKILKKFRQDPAPWSLPKDLDLDDVKSKQRLTPPGMAEELVERYLVSRALCEERLLEAMGEYPFDLLILAGFMRIITPYFIDRVNGDAGLPRIMNIHPALLPSFPGTDGYGDTFAYGCKVGGCTVHFVDYGEDSGPVIGQRSFPIEPGDDLEMVKKKGLEEEWKLFPDCIQLYAQSRLSLSFNREGGRRVVAIK